MRGTIAALALAALVAAPLAGAQLPVPLPRACDGLEIVSVVVTSALAPGETGSAEVSVRNRGNLTMDVRVGMAVLEQGWEGEETEKERLDLQPDQEARLRFDVRPDDTATEDGIVSVIAQGTCDGGGVAGCPEDACTTGEASASARIALVRPEGVGVPFLGDLRVPLPALVAGLLVVGGLAAAPFVIARRRPRGVVADCPEPLKLVRPGRGASFPVELRNPAQTPATATLDVGAVPEGWSAFMPLPDVQLAARESRSLFLMVRAPPEAPPGDAVDIDLTVRDGAGRETVVRVRAEVHAGAPEA